MTRQRGIASGWLILIAVALLGLALAGAYAKGRSNGKAGERAAWTERELQINTETAAKLKDANDRLIATERAHAAALADVSADYQRKLKENDDAKNAVIAGVRAGTRKLYIGAKCPAAGGDAVPGAAAGAGGRDAEPRAELHESAARFLVELASEADAVTRQLAACQAVVTSDRRL